jgi:hypothetical protein
MTVVRPPIPTEQRKPAWRRAYLAYRKMRQAGGAIYLVFTLLEASGSAL